MTLRITLRGRTTQLRQSFTCEHMSSALHFRLPDPKATVFHEILKEVGAKEWRIVPKRPAAFALRGFCDENVMRQIEDKGGMLCWGWDLVEHPTGAIESEAHCVWRAPDSQLIDITPSDYGFKNIMFLVVEATWGRPLPPGKGWPTRWDEIARFQADIITVRHKTRQLLELQGVAEPGKIVTLNTDDIESAIAQACLQTGRSLSQALLAAVLRNFTHGPGVISRSYK